MYEPKIGDVALYNGDKVVVLNIRQQFDVNMVLRTEAKIRFKKTNEIMHAVPVSELQPLVGTEPTINKLKAGRRVEK